MSSPEDVQRAKQAHELQPLQTAWDEWIHTKQVSIIPTAFFEIVCSLFLMQ